MLAMTTSAPHDSRAAGVAAKGSLWMSRWSAVTIFQSAGVENRRPRAPTALRPGHRLDVGELAAAEAVDTALLGGVDSPDLD